MQVTRVWKAVLSVVVCELAGAIGSVFTFPSIGTWYASLAKPWFTPPNWLFGPVWLTLYALMGIALGLVWGRGLGSKEVRMAIVVFAFQLALNVLWSIVFFGVQSLFYGFVVIVLLWVAIALTIALFLRVSRWAGLLLVPYICWVTIATLLNFYIWLLNP